MKELLEIIYESEEILKFYQGQDQNEKMRKMKSIFDELSEIDHKMDLHFKTNIMETNPSHRHSF